MRIHYKSWAGIVLLFNLILLSSPASADSERLATTVPVVKMIADSLLRDTAIEVDYLPPKRLPYSRIASWLQHKAPAAELARYDALLTFESLRPDLAAYTRLRKDNIHLVPVDLATEFAPGGMKISPKHRDGYFWLHPDNLLMMVNIAAADLARIWPEEAEQLSENHQALRRHIQQYQLSLDQLLLDAEIDEVIIKKAELIQAALSTALPLSSETDTDSDFDAHRLVITTKGRKDDKMTRPRVWKIDPIARYNKGTLPELLDLNIQSLRAALAG